MSTRIAFVLAACALLLSPLVSTAVHSDTVAAPLQQPPTVTLTLPPAPTLTLTLPPAPTFTVTLPPADTPTLPPGVTPTPVPTNTPGGPLPDLIITKVDVPDVVPPGGIINYVITVSNVGAAPSQPTNVVDELSSGTGLEGVGPGCAPSANIVTCLVPALDPGESVSFTLGIRPLAGPGTVVNTAYVDRPGLVVEANEANNVATTTTTVALLPGMPPPGFPPPGFPPPPGMPSPAVEVVAPPIDVAGSQVLPPQAAPGELWLQVLAPTQAFSVDMDPLWMASPGEWYIVTGSEPGWALSVWEADTTGWSVWIQMDGRVNATMVDRADPRIAADVWLVAFAATEVYSAATMELIRMASPGEWYRVLQHDGSWALVAIDAGPSGWIRIDGRVELGPGDAPHSPM